MAVGAHELRVHRLVGAPREAVLELTGWAVGEGLHSALHPLHGWTTQDVVRAPAGTAFTRWAEVPRLTGPPGQLYAALAALTPSPLNLSEAITETTATENSIEFQWKNGTTTRVDFTPLTVTHFLQKAVRVIWPLTGRAPGR